MDTLLQHVLNLHGYTNLSKGFNPCFNGYTTSTNGYGYPQGQMMGSVSILVLMDTLLQHEIYIRL